MSNLASDIDLKALWRELDAYEAELERETETLQNIWTKIIELKDQNDREAEILLNEDEFRFMDPDHDVILNIGGHLFETKVAVLTRDPFSILAACCRERPHPNLIPDKDTGIIYFDRDWWLFRHIIAFLRSNVLPNDLDVLKELYVEASFYRLEILSEAIREFPLDSLVFGNPSEASVADRESRR